MSPGEKIRIEDLRNPVLNDPQKAALAHGEANPVELTLDSVLKAAVEVDSPQSSQSSWAAPSIVPAVSER